MKKIFFTTLVTFIALFILPGLNYAQGSDTLVVSALPPGNLFDVISADTNASGQRNPNRVYVLQQTGSEDTVYFVSYTLKTTYNVNIVGKTNPLTGHPPVIEPFINVNNSSPGTLFQPTRGSINLSNLYFLGYRTDKLTRTGIVVQVKGDSVPVAVNNCVIDGFSNNVILISASHCKLSVRNTEFRDIINLGSTWVGSAFPIDTLKLINDTFFDVQFSDFGDLGWVGYLQYEHNTSFLGSWNPINVPQLTNGVIRDNIFYCLASYGGDSSLIKSFLYAPASNQFGYSVFYLDSLVSLLNPPYNLTEASRNVVVQNNAYYWPQSIYNYWTSVSDTTHISGLITPPKWMDEQTKSMFNDKQSWPGLYAANNDSTDPGFSSSLVTSGTDSLIKFIDLMWKTGTAGDFHPCPLITDPTNKFALVASNWATTQGYPVPENLAYSNTAMQSAGSDGFALGDLNWYPNQLKLYDGQLNGIKEIPNVIPTNFILSQNYPNPFNPTTIINYSVPKSSFVSLKVYNVLGQEVATLYEGFQKAGYYKSEFNATKLASGVYLYRLQSNGFSVTKKMILMK